MLLGPEVSLFVLSLNFKTGWCVTGSECYLLFFEKKNSKIWVQKVKRGRIGIAEIAVGIVKETLGS